MNLLFPHIDSLNFTKKNIVYFLKRSTQILNYIFKLFFLVFNFQKFMKKVKRETNKNP